MLSQVAEDSIKSMYEALGILSTYQKKKEWRDFANENGLKIKPKKNRRTGAYH